MELEMELPETWRKRQIRQIGTVVTGRTPSTKREEFYGGDYKLISPADLDNGKYVVTAHKRLSLAGFNECRALPKDTVLVGCIGNIGKLGMVADEKSATNQQINAVICNEEHDAHFLYYCLHANCSRLEQAADKTTLPILNKTNFENFQIPVPPLPEQRKIAGVLGVVQRAMEQQERLLALTAELKKALLRQLFTAGLRGGPQKQTEIGPMPKNWEVATLGNVAIIERGKFTHRPRNEPRFYGGTTPFVQTGDVSNCDGRISTYSQTLNDDGVRISKVFATGTILITIAANIGFTGILEFDSACPDSLIGLTPNDRIGADFLQYYLSTQQPGMDRLAPRGTQKNINIQFLKPWPVPVPSKEEQSEIVSFLKALDSKLRNGTRKHAALTDLFRTLLHQLMTAQLRVHGLDLPELEAVIEE